MTHENRYDRIDRLSYRLPENFKWVAFDQIKSLFPVPNNWNICFESKKHINEYSAYIKWKEDGKLGQYILERYRLPLTI